MNPKRKLIEVSLPLEEINAQSAREKSIRYGHPSTLHLWWARRPLATARAVLFSQLVDDPSNRFDDYRQEAVDKGNDEPSAWAERRVNQERERLFKLVKRMVDWDNLSDEALFDEVRAEILSSTNGNPPAILDPFAGGGTIPLEAQRLGLEAHASDLNPVAVLINKALIEIPPRFTGQPPVFPGAAEQRNDWPRASGLAEDVRRYGAVLRNAAEKRVGHLYPKAKLSDGSTATVIAWIWARTLNCPNPACGIEMPLVKSWWLSKAKGKEAFAVPYVDQGRVRFRIAHDVNDAPTGADDGTVGRQGAICVSCGTAVPLTYIRTTGKTTGLGQVLVATVAEGNRRRIYLEPDEEQESGANISKPDAVPDAEIPKDGPGAKNVPLYGLTTFASLFTNRQLNTLTTFSDLVAEIREGVLLDATSAGLSGEARLDLGGKGAEAYADAVAIYLGIAVSNTADDHSSLVSWRSSHGTGATRSTFARQALPMVWDFAEANPFSGTAGDFSNTIPGIAAVLERLPSAQRRSFVLQEDAASVSEGELLLSTDPPYYDNIGYSDLSDFFYVWLRRTLRSLVPALLETLLVPKSDELVANPLRHGSAGGAKRFFEQGFEHVFQNARRTANADFPITVYYAFKQSEDGEGGEASTGWETILGSIVGAGWRVTATWPVRSEKSGRMIGSGANALASSVVLALRPRPEDAPTTDRRGFIAAMKGELGPALRELQQGGIAPVDLPQSAIGPGMAVFSRYAKVIESDGSEMTVRSALARINEVLDELLTEQEGDFDPTTRFAIAWYRSHGYAAGVFGDAENLARARATAVSAMERSAILSARAGNVQLFRPADLPNDYDVASDRHTSAWEALQHAIRIQETKGIPAAGAFLNTAGHRSDGAVDLDLVKELAYLLFQVAEKNGWTKDAISFNGIATSWSELLESGRGSVPVVTATTLDFDGLE